MGNTTYSVSAILFSPDGSKLIADAKGVVQSNAPGFMAVWDVESNGSLSQSHETILPPTKIGQQNFGMVYLEGLKDGYFVTEANKGGLLYDFSKGYTTAKVTMKEVIIPNQLLTCWLSYSSKSDSYFLSDSGTEIVNEFKVNKATLNSTLVNQYQLPKSAVILDNIIGVQGKNQYLYQLDVMGATIYVFDVQQKKSKLIQSYNFTQPLVHDRVPFSVTVQGMAIHMK